MKESSKNEYINKNSSVFFATFAVYASGKPLPANGMIDPVRAFFVPRVRNFLLLIQPHPGSDRIPPILEIYEKNRKIRDIIISPLLYFPLYFLCKIQNVDSTHISFKLRDLLSVLYVSFSRREKYDIFIGLESINALAGLMLKRLGRVQTVIYYVSDYAPNRYRNIIFNKIYLWLDKFCIEHADFTWDVSPAIKEARIKIGLLKRNSNRILYVPNGLFASQINPLPVTKRIPESIVYMGLLDSEQGVDLALEAFKLVHKKKPRAIFHIIGGTNRDPKPFIKMVKDIGMKDSVVFYGFVPPNQKMADIINKCYVGIATYKADRNPRNQYGDSGKIRQYLACGLPIVATSIQWYTKHAIEKGAGIEAKETPEDFARGIMKLFEDKAQYERCSKKAVELSRDNTWENSYSNAFLEMEKLNNK